MRETRGPGGPSPHGGDVCDALLLQTARAEHAVLAGDMATLASALDARECLLDAMDGTSAPQIGLADVERANLSLLTHARRECARLASAIEQGERGDTVASAYEPRVAAVNFTARG